MIRHDALARLQLHFGTGVGATIERLRRFIVRVWDEQRRRFGPPPELVPDDGPAMARPYPWEAAYPPGIGWELEVPERPLAALLADAAARHPERTCIECLDRRYSYATLARDVAHATQGLQALGVGPGARVALLLPNTPFFVVAYFAVLRAGGTVVDVNPLYAEAEIAHILVDSGARVVVTIDEAALYDKLAAVLDATPVERVVVAPTAGLLGFARRSLHRLFGRWRQRGLPPDPRHVAYDWLLANDGQPAPLSIDPKHDIAVLHYTGGIDGDLKAAMLTHKNLYANVVQAARWFGELTVEARILGALPLSQVFGISCVLNIGVAVGATIILLPRFGLEPMLRAIDKHRVTVLPGVPAMFAMLVASPRCQRFDLSSLALGVAAGAPLPAALQERFEAIIGARLIEGYGLTEAAPIVTSNPVVGRRRGDSVGLPMPGTVIEIRSVDASKRLLPIGVVGEVCVRGPQVMAGYWNRPAATAAVLMHGRLHTGDLGYLDADGYLHLAGRLKRLILVGGYNVYPNRVQAAIESHPMVASAEVSGVPDSRLGERVRAVIRLAPEATLAPDEFRRHLRPQLAPFEIPREIEIVEAAAEADPAAAALEVARVA